MGSLAELSTFKSSTNNVSGKRIIPHRHSKLHAKYKRAQRSLYWMLLMATTPSCSMSSRSRSPRSSPPWGRYRYLRLPQGFLAAGYAYTRRYDDIIADVPRKETIVDDAILYDSGIEESFFHVWDFLDLCAHNGIFVNEEKLQFCQDIVDFAGLLITSTGVAPTEAILSAIKNFPRPEDLTSSRSWFGLVNQVAWAYSISTIM